MVELVADFSDFNSEGVQKAILPLPDSGNVIEKKKLQKVML